MHDVARRFGRSEAAIRLRAPELGLIAAERRRRWSTYEDQLVPEGYEQGLSCDEVAAHLARSSTAVAARARRLGSATYARWWRPDEDAAMRTMAAAGVATSVAADRLSRTPEAVRRLSHALGIDLPADLAPNGGRRWSPREDSILRELSALSPDRLARCSDARIKQ